MKNKYQIARELYEQCDYEHEGDYDNPCPDFLEWLDQQEANDQESDSQDPSPTS